MTEMSLKSKDFDNILHLFLWYLNKDEVYLEIYKQHLAHGLTRSLITSIVSLLLGGLTAKYWILPYWQRRKKRALYRMRIQSAQKRRLYEIEYVRKQCDKLVDDGYTQEIIKTIGEGPMAIYRKLQNGSITPTQVVMAYQHNMVIAQDETNCLTSVLTDAFDQAQDLERRYLGKPKPKLYGVIFSVKDMYDIKGRDSTVGLAQFLDQPKEEDCVLVKVLKRHGAIIIAKTGCSQGLLSCGAGNPIFGTVNNPNSYSRCAGGSSSGEGALLAMNGSMAGAGSDLGGSLRIPAHFCGICCLRPTNGRISTKGVLECVAGYKGVESVKGLLSRDVDFLAECHAAVLGPEMFRLDPQVPPIPWRPEIYNNQGPLRIGYFVDDGYFTPTPGVTRATKMAVDGLRGLGHTLVPFADPDPSIIVYNNDTPLLQDCGVQRLEVLDAEYIDSCILSHVSLLKALNGNIFIKQKLLLSAKYSSTFNYINLRRVFDLRSPFELMKVFAKRDEYRQLFIKKWQEMRLDALICPVSGMPAVASDIPGQVAASQSYCRLFNYLDFPAGVVPVASENEDDQRELESYRQDDSVYVITKDAVRGAIGMPIGVQCVSLPFQEEMTLRVMRDVQNSAGRDMFMKAAILSH